MIKRTIFVTMMILFLCFGAGCRTSEYVEPDPDSLSLEAVKAYPNLTFEQPLYATTATDDMDMIYVVQRNGNILIFEDSAETTETTVFLDISGIVNRGGQEQGLLGLAFHPDYANNGYFYVNYTDNQGSVIARYTRDVNDPMKADPASAVILLTFDQPYSNHNGGHLAFGPDGYLYIATGDGGSGGDPDNNAQNLSNLLGKILRINVDQTSEGMMYAIPSDNPFAGNTQGYREEIYAYGLRNPWKFSFSSDGTLWVGDVGQGEIEEIDWIVSGGNYGWSIKEGSQDYKPIEGVDTSDFIEPVWEYNHSQGHSITGGYVYTGSQFSKLQNAYLYGDFIYGNVWAFWIDDEQVAHNEKILQTNLNIASFGLDSSDEILIIDFNGGIYRLAETASE